FKSTLHVPILQASQPQGNGWRYTFFSVQGTDTIYAYALCAKGPLTVASVQRLTKTLPGGSSVVAYTVACPSGQLLTDGGVNMDSGYFAQVRFDMDQLAPDTTTWQVRAVNVDQTVATASAYAVCVRLHQ